MPFETMTVLKRAVSSINNAFGTNVGIRAQVLVDKKHFIEGLRVKIDNAHEISASLPAESSGSLSEIKQNILGPLQEAVALAALAREVRLAN
jgi:hypothetical protein